MRTYKHAARQAQLLLLEAMHPAPGPDSEEIDPRPEMLCFRAQTVALLRHFFELSCQIGRLPSLLGREFFRARVSHQTLPSFEDQVVFSCDVELCLSRLSDHHAEIVTLVGLYDFGLEEVAGMLRCSKSAVHQWFAEALDALSEFFLEAGLLAEDRPDRRQRQVMQRNLPAGVPRKPPQSVKTLPETVRAGGMR